MKKIFFLMAMLMVFTLPSFAQLGIGTTTPDSKSMLDVVSTDKGVLIPRMTTLQREDIDPVPDGLMVYDVTTHSIWFYKDDTWTEVVYSGGSSSNAWMTTGNSGTGASNFIGTTDNVPLKFRVNNLPAGIIQNGNTGFGYNTLASITSGDNNLAMGQNALQNNTTGGRNVAIGFNTLNANLDGESNLAIGGTALQANQHASSNIALGMNSLQTLTAGDGNTVVGGGGLQLHTTGAENVGIGINVLRENISGTQNVAVGSYAGIHNTGSGNVFLGHSAGYNETGDNLLYIANSNTDTPLIWGDFDNSILGFNGRVGIGTQSPYTDFRLHVYNEDNPSMSNILVGPWWGGSPGAPGIWVNSLEDGPCGVLVGGSHGSGGMYWYDDANNMTIMSAYPVLIQPGGVSQYVGIGTYNPTNRLHLADPGGNPLRIENLVTQSGTTQALVVDASGVVFKGGSGTGLSWLLTGNSNTDSTTNFIGTTNAQALIFKTNNSERLRINKVGNVGIGTTIPDAKLHVQKRANGDVDLLKLAHAFPAGASPSISNVLFSHQVPNGSLKTFARLAFDVPDIDPGHENCNWRFFVNNRGTEEERLTLYTGGEVQTYGPINSGGSVTAFGDFFSSQSYNIQGKTALRGDMYLGGHMHLNLGYGGGAGTGFSVIHFITDGAERMRIDSVGHVGIGTDNPASSAMLDVASTSKGILIPRMTTANRTGIGSPADGLMVYDITTHSLWFWKNGSWTEVVYSGTSGSSPWDRTGGNTYLHTSDDWVGIGTSAPSAKLDVYEPNTDLEVYFHTLTGGPPEHDGVMNLKLDGEAESRTIYMVDGVSHGDIHVHQNTGGFYDGLHINGINRINMSVNDSTKLTVLNNGNVGIGVVDPLNPLHIRKNATGDQDLLKLERKFTTAAPSKSSIVFNHQRDDGSLATFDKLTWDVTSVGVDLEESTWIFSTLSRGSMNNVLKLYHNGQVEMFNRLDVGGDIFGQTLNGTGTLKLMNLYALEAENISGTKYLHLGYAVSFDNLLFHTGGSERMRLNAAGNLGIATSAPHSTLHVNGSFATTIGYTGTGFTLGDQNQIVACSASLTLTLPTAVGIAGRQYTIKRTYSGVSDVTIGTTSGQTIDGSATASLANQWDYITVVSDGINWLIIGHN